MNLKYDFTVKSGTIKPMHGIGQPPFVGVSDSLFHYISDAGMPYSRLHDVGGAYGGNRYVDIHNIFRENSFSQWHRESISPAVQDIFASKKPRFNTAEGDHRFSFIF